MNTRVVYIDETEYWNADFVKKSGKMIGVYLYDHETRVNCCEITPSYELWFVGTVAENMLDDNDAVAIWEANADRNEVEYYRSLKGFEAADFGEFDTIDDAIEYWNANPKI